MCATAAVNVILLGPGLVGREVLRQIHSYNTTAAGRQSLRVCAVANSRKMLLLQPDAPADLPDVDWEDTFARYFTTPAGGGATDSQAADSLWTEVPVASNNSDNGHGSSVAHLDTLATHGLAHMHGVHGCVLIDCSSSDDVALAYPSLLRRGIHIVTPNKKAFSSELGLYREIVKICRKVPGTPYPLCMHEATVGAGLPILSTLHDMVATGDHITKIEGVFSGTLSYIFNEFSTPNPPPSNTPAPRFSEILCRAKALGYTEPDPRDDLNGIDVARKVVILSRVAKMDLALETLPVENVVPPELRSVASVDEFMAKLPQFDDHFDQLNQKARAKSCVLRLVGVVSGTPPGKDGRSEVKLRSYPYSHPFAQLRGSDNIVAFHTARYPERPLVVQGSGAGAAVTAAGVMGDLLKVAEIVCYNRP